MDNALIVTTIGGFVPHFEMNNVKILQDMGYVIHYASDFNNPVYECNKETLYQMGIKLHQIDIKKSPRCVYSNIKAIYELVRIIDDNNITLIHCHNPMGGFTARVAAHISRKKPHVIYTAHGFHFYKGAPVINWIAYYPVERLLARWTDVIVTINKEDYVLAGKFHLKRDGFVVHINGVGIDMDKFSPDKEKRRDKRKELGIPENAFHIVTVAELNSNKNQAVIINAIALMNNPDTHYTICGDGPEKNRLESIIKTDNLEHQIQLLGYRHDVAEILKTADVFAFPSRREGLGLAAIEALACGVPVVASNNRGTREYIKNEINGIFCHTDNTEDYIDAFNRLYQDKEYRLKLASECRNSIEEYDYRKIMKVMKIVYQRFMDCPDI